MDPLQSMNKELKKEVYEKCLSDLSSKIDNCEQEIKSLKESRDSETKSSAGDKYETARAMAQQEIDQLSAHLLVLQKQLYALEKIDIAKNNSVVSNGSFVYLNTGLFFIAESIGKIEVQGQQVFCLSTSAPLAKILADRKAGESVSFNGKEYKIEEIR